MRSFIAGGLCLTCFSFLLGCGGDPEEVRNRISGTIKFAGKDIVHGDILFSPDGAKQNTGAQGIALIRNGKYDTSAAGGKGYGGGPAVIRVTGFTEEGGKLLCEHEFQADLPKGDTVHDIDVPAKAGPKQKGTPEI